MFNKLFTWFENRIETYPNEQPKTPKSGLFPFIYDATKGMRFYLILLTIWSIGSIASARLNFGQRKAVQLLPCFASQS